MKISETKAGNVQDCSKNLCHSIPKIIPNVKCKAIRTEIHASSIIPNVVFEFSEHESALLFVRHIYNTINSVATEYSLSNLIYRNATQVSYKYSEVMKIFNELGITNSQLFYEKLCTENHHSPLPFANVI